MPRAPQLVKPGAEAPRRVLVAPLDWGLGHAARCVPVVHALLDRGAKVILGGEGRHMELLREEFPDLATVPLVNYHIHYGATPFGTMLRFPGMLARVYRCAAREHRQLDGIVTKHAVDTVISDQRFGCHSKRAHSVYLTHQLCLKMPRGFGFAEPLFHRGLLTAALRFDEVWIPDFDGPENLTGDLTRRHPLPPNSRFVGPLSRLARVPRDARVGEDLDLLVMLSGPEPQRSIFENAVLSELRSFDGTATVLLGTPGAAPRPSLSSRVTVLAHASAVDTAGLLRRARAIVCRAGYTTIMELAAMGKRAVLVPTPGQTEQEYLCRHLESKGLFAGQPQRSFSLRAALGRLGNSPVAHPLRLDDSLLAAAIDRTLSHQTSA